MIPKYLHDFLVEYEALDGSTRRAVFRKLEEFRRTPPAGFAHQALKGESFRGLFKLRAGDYRLIYRVADGECLFITLGHRSDVYR